MINLNKLENELLEKGYIAIHSSVLDKEVIIKKYRHTKVPDGFKDTCQFIFEEVVMISEFKDAKEKEDTMKLLDMVKTVFPNACLS